MSAFEISRIAQSGLGALVSLAVGSAAIACGSSAPTKVAVVLTEWSVTAAPASANAGPVTFAVSNKGAATHEMVVIQSDLDTSKLPRIAPGDPPVEGHPVGDVNEEKLTSAGESGNLDVGASKTVTLQLKAGRYILLCNLPAHFGQGMYAIFSVS